MKTLACFGGSEAAACRHPFSVVPFTPLIGCFHLSLTVPCALSVTREYLGLEGTPPSSDTLPTLPRPSKRGWPRAQRRKSIRRRRTHHRHGDGHLRVIRLHCANAAGRVRSLLRGAHLYAQAGRVGAEPSRYGVTRFRAAPKSRPLLAAMTSVTGAVTLASCIWPDMPDLGRARAAARQSGCRRRLAAPGGPGHLASAASRHLPAGRTSNPEPCYQLHGLALPRSVIRQI